jgi:modification methylase
MTMEFNRLIVGDAAGVLSSFPDGCIDLIGTSPPYWTAVTYGHEVAPVGYEDYLDGLDRVWAQCAQVLRPGGKLAINTAMMPIPKDVMPAEVPPEYPRRYRPPDQARWQACPAG